MGHVLNSRLDGLTHPLTQVVLTSLLQPNNPRLTSAPQFPVQRVARIDDERRQLDHARVVYVAVIGDDDHAISLANFLVV